MSESRAQHRRQDRQEDREEFWRPMSSSALTSGKSVVPFIQIRSTPADCNSTVCSLAWHFGDVLTAGTTPKSTDEPTRFVHYTVSGRASARHSQTLYQHCRENLHDVLLCALLWTLDVRGIGVCWYSLEEAVDGGLCVHTCRSGISTLCY